MRWSVQLDANEEEKRKCMNVRADAALKWVDLSREVCQRKCSDLQDEIDVCYVKVDRTVRTEIDEWAINERDKLVERF